MASPNTIKLKRDRELIKMLAIKDVTPKYNTGPNHARRRLMIQNWARTFNVPYAAAREVIRAEEAKYRAAGIDPYDPEAAEKLEAHEKGIEYVPPPKNESMMFRGTNEHDGERII